MFLRPDGTVRAERPVHAAGGGLDADLAPGDRLGRALVAPGDLDGDGTQDLIAGVSDAARGHRGAALVLFLRPDGTVRRHDRIGTDEAGPFGEGDQWAPRASLGDLDGDGRAELLFGSRLADAGGPERGAVRVTFTDYATHRDGPPEGSGVALGPPFPNPASGLVTVRFRLPAPGPARLDVADALGRTVASASGAYAAGGAEATFDASGWAAGVYVVRLRARGETVAARLVVVR